MLLRIHYEQIYHSSESIGVSVIFPQYSMLFVHTTKNFLTFRTNILKSQTRLRLSKQTYNLIVTRTKIFTNFLTSVSKIVVVFSTTGILEGEKLLRIQKQIAGYLSQNCITYTLLLKIIILILLQT